MKNKWEQVVEFVSGRPFTSREFTAKFGKCPNTAWTYLNTLNRAGFVKHIGTGMWRGTPIKTQFRKAKLTYNYALGCCPKVSTSTPR